MGRSLIYLVFCFILVINVISLPIITEKELIVPRQGDYHIGSRYDPTKELINSVNGPKDDDEGKLINPAVRAPSSPALLPWEDDPEIGYVTDKLSETTKAPIMVTSSSTIKSSTYQSTTVSPISTDRQPGGHLH